MAKFKSLNIGDTVRVVSLADTVDRCGASVVLNDYIGGTFKVTQLKRQSSTNLGQVHLSNGWWFSPKGLEVLTPVGDACGTPTGDEHGEFVTPETPVGTRVLYLGGSEDLSTEAGTEFILRRHDADEYPRVDYTDKDDFEYIHYNYLRIHVADTSSTDEPAECTKCTEPTPEPVGHTTEDFKYTRVRVKYTGAEGVVVGRSKGGSVAVLHDETSDSYHGGNIQAADFVGVTNRIWYYGESDLEIIGGVQ